jgi:hypothetical protein
MEAEQNNGRNRATVPAVPQDDLDLILDALRQVTSVLTTAGTQLAKLTVPGAGVDVMSNPATAAEVNTWDDPFTETVPSTNPPLATVRPATLIANANPRMRVAIVEPQPPAARYAPGSPGFLYWVAAEALNRGISFWGPLLPAGTTWSTSNPMRVVLVDSGAVLNAGYRRIDGLHFYRKTVSNIDIRSGESPDVVCHELGHAVLDALRPQLFNAADTEVGAFHEAFGDISAILCALQHQPFRQSIISETGGRLNVNSRLSRLGEQLGWGIRQLSRDAVDRDSLRNAANRFFYRRANALPPSAPANLLSSEPHSFSRVFTGAFLDILARMFLTTGAPGEANLLAVSRDIGQLVVDAVLGAPITPAYFSQLAAAMIQADQARFGGRNRAALNGAFLERGILSVSSATAMADAPVPTAVGITPRAAAFGISSLIPGAAGVEEAFGASTMYAYSGEAIDEGFRAGYRETPELPSSPLNIAGFNIEVHAPVQPRRFDVASSMVGSDTDLALGADVTTRVFVEGLIQRREIDLGPEAPFGDAGPKDATRLTHSLVTEDGRQILKRNHFDCGFCQRNGARAAFTCL